MKKSLKILAKIAYLAVRDMPKSWGENGTNLWEAFNLGRKYEKELFTEKEKRDERNNQ